MPQDSLSKATDQACLRIILVEDDNILSMAMKSMLKKLGHKVIAVENSGQGAISRAMEEEPDLMFVDIYLKDDVTGINVVEELQEKIKSEFVYITGNSDPGFLSQAKNTKHLDYLVKPVSYQVIKDTLANVLKSR